MPYRLLPMDNSAAPPLDISDRLRSQLVYFMTPPDEPQVPPLGPKDYWIDAEQAAEWMADGVFELVSPLSEERPHEIGQEHEGAVQHTDQHRRSGGVVAANLAG